MLLYKMVLYKSLEILTIIKTAAVYVGFSSCRLSIINPTPYQKDKAYVAYIMSHIIPLPKPEYIPLRDPVFIAGSNLSLYLMGLIETC